MESIPGLLKRLQIRAQDVVHPIKNGGSIGSVGESAWSSGGSPEALNCQGGHESVEEATASQKEAAERGCGQCLKKKCLVRRRP